MAQAIRAYGNVDGTFCVGLFPESWAVECRGYICISIEGRTLFRHLEPYVP